MKLLSFGRQICLFMLLVGLVLALAACGEATPPGIKSAQLSKDYNQGEAVGVTTTFATADPAVHCVIVTNNDTNGVKIRLVWTLVSGSDGTADKKVNESEFITFVNLKDYDNSYRPDSGKLTAGKYKVDIYFGDKLDRTLEFTVQ